MLSRITSRHHWYIVRKFVSSPSARRFIELKLNHIASPEVISSADRAPVSGQGLGLTIW